MFSRGKEIMSIQQRLDKNKSFYHIKNLSYESKAFVLRDYFDDKYNIDIEQIVADLFDMKKYSDKASFVFFFKKIPALSPIPVKRNYFEK